MFDIGFQELLLIGVVALLVVGPERLPAVARTAGVWVGKIRRMVAQVKSDVERELHAEELKQMVEKPEQLDDLYGVLEETKQGLDETIADISSGSAQGPAPAGDAQSPPDGEPRT